MVKYNRKYRRKAVAGIPPPRKVAPKPKKDTKSGVRQNAESVHKLALAVKKLQMSQYGGIQKNVQNSNNSLYPTAQYPLLFDCTDFTCYRNYGVVNQQGCRVYQYGVGGLSAVGGWNIQDFLGNPYHERENYDQVDTGRFLPISVKYTIRIEGVRSLDNTRIRLDVFQARSKSIVQSSVASGQVLLPTGLIHLDNMADPTQNRLSSVYFKKYFTKQVFINSTKTDPDTKGTTGNIKYISFMIRPKKPRTQAQTEPNNPQDADPEITEGNYGPLNVPVDQPLWALISTDDRTALGDAVKIDMSRSCVWRDGQGQANF